MLKDLKKIKQKITIKYINDALYINCILASN
jgi:hypothetical protein